MKRVKDRVLRSAENEATYHVEKKINQAIDDLLTPSEKKTNTGSKKNSQNTNTENKESNDDLQKKDGFITVSLSADKIFQGGAIVFAGESVSYEKYNQVEIVVKGPSFNESYNAALGKDHKYITTWYASGKKGKYQVTIKSSDGKAETTVGFEVFEQPFIDNLTEDNIETVMEAYVKLKEKTEKVRGSISSKDAGELDKKMSIVKDKIDAILKLYTGINRACKEISTLAKGKSLPQSLADNLSALNNEFSKQTKNVKQAMEFAKHEPADNSICEYLVMVNEACAAFSTFTNLWSKSIATILQNIILDKGVPKGTEILNNSYKTVSGDYDIALKEPAKIFATSKADAESLTTKLGTAGLAGDIVQFASDYLLKQYCGVYKGEFKHDYTVTFRNEEGQTWWKYTVEMQASFTLRYPKDKNTGNVIKMKGNLEGNATRFSFFTNLAEENEFKKTAKGKIELIELRKITPPAVPFVTSQNDVFGFGAIARTAATPACFNIPLDAEFNKDDETIKLFVNDALIDFTPAVKNRLVFVMFSAGLPLLRWMEFPIHKAWLTTNAVIRDNNEFKVSGSSGSNPYFSGKGNKHTGSANAPIEQNLNFSIRAKKE